MPTLLFNHKSMEYDPDRSFLLGMAMKLSQQHLQYQANSVKNSPVLSYQFMGLRAFRDRQLRIKNREWHAAYQHIQNLMRQPLNV